MNKPVERIAVSKFKATCFAVLERVHRTGKPVIVTRHGEPIAEVIPASPAAQDAGWLGSMRGTARCVGDIVSPASDPEEWEALGSKEE